MKRLPMMLLAAALALPAMAQDKKDEAQAAARQWLAQVDAGEYRQAWEGTAAIFRERVTPEAWTDLASQARDPLGATKSRRLATARYATELPGAPPGEYVLMEFDTTFENKAKAVETVTTLSEDGQWRVAGYFVR